MAPPVCTTVPSSDQVFTLYPVFAVAVKVMLPPAFTVCAVLGLMAPLAPADGVMV